MSFFYQMMPEVRLKALFLSAKFHYISKYTFSDHSKFKNHKENYIINNVHLNSLYLRGKLSPCEERKVMSQVGTYKILT